METNEKQPYRVIISGGGTGGHIFPAIAIANELKSRDPEIDILFVGAENRMEMKKVPEAGYKIIGLNVVGLDRKHLWKNFTVPFKLLESFRKTRRIVKDFNPDVVVGVGGYASAPTLETALFTERNQWTKVKSISIRRFGQCFRTPLPRNRLGLR